MGKLITVVGNSGIGKTTLALRLCEIGSFIPLLEKNEERPFQKDFQEDLKGYSLPNQVDFLLFRAGQENYVRENDIVGVQDGGLDQDFHVFTKLFHHKGYLDDEEYHLCKRLYSTLRQFLPPPDLIIQLTAPVTTLAERMVKRGRDIDIAKSEDLASLEALIEDWLTNNASSPMITFDASEEDPSYTNIAENLLRDVKTKLNIS